MVDGGVEGLSLLQGFSYRRGASLLHRLDPRTKVALTASLILSAIILRGRLELSLALAAASLAFVASTGQFKHWLKTLRGLALLALLVLIVNWWTVGPSFALSLVFLLLTLTASSSVFFMTTSPDDLSLALIKLKLPYELVLELSMAIRFAPTLAERRGS
jgi:energy-coupling factor transport system permease protein